MGGPQFKLRIAVGAQPGEIVVAARKQIDANERLRVTPIETFCESNDS
jgi:hypothetical protein